MYKYYQKLPVFLQNTFGIKFITMKDLEFYIFENELWCISSDKKNKRISENDTEIINEILSIVREQYPNAYNALSECYIKSSKNVPYYQYLMARRFAKCNFGNLDSTVEDINKNGKVSFEHVLCPLRGECKYEDIICNPQFNSSLSDAEMRVMKLVYDGNSNDDIADSLYLSPHTVKNHIKSVYRKLGIHEKSEFIQYAHNNNLFND